MDDEQILDTINSLRDVKERQALRALVQREGHTALFKAALAAAIERQEQTTRREETIMRPARWVARKTGHIVGRTMRRLEAQAEKAERDKEQP